MFQKDQDQKTTRSIDWKPRPMHGPSINEDPIRDQMQTDFPKPSNSRKDKKHQDQRPDRVIAKRIQAGNQRSLLFFGNRKQAPWILFGIQHIRYCLVTLIDAHILLVFFFLFPFFKKDPEPIRKETFESVKLWFLYMTIFVFRICFFQFFLTRKFKQIHIVHLVGIFDVFCLGLFS